ncbi:DUF397 domain-containing protein [Streptomyces lomondensis]|uniref:DUF397 domain-containing protein n=1 Tax=Streptomyces lomondensis TaxID=68229 RepID=A0ABQ2XNK2_9ACTN|nr:DUF397 domain-containing protein [Streptomyces lomondensis]MCF0080963.1 DUF397 domain-containing protein [Streptomyces lomondensis]GGX25361.1 DUF397 domain-containing protein [Streptomyces lomondensis]
MSELHWQKSTYSPDASNCVEIATTPTAVHIRDSKHPASPRLTLRPTAWAGFLSLTAPAKR